MRYSKVTVEVIFEHDDSVPAVLAAMSIARRLDHGDVLNVTGNVPESLTEDEVIRAAGGCGECDGCKAARDELATHAVMEGSALAQVMGTADAGAVAVEQAAVQRARYV